MQDWKEVKCDAIVLSLYKLQNYYFTEILRGFCDLGNFQLKDEFIGAKRNPRDVEFPAYINPDEIVDKIRHDLINFDNPLFSIASNEISEIEEKSLETSKISKLEKPYVPCTQQHQAMSVIEEKRITHVPKNNAFIIVGTDPQKIYLTKLFPKESCTCPATNTCYHILAARKSIGINILPAKKHVNLSLLMRKSRKRNDKKSGRKKPRPQDYDVVPASDSIVMTSTPSRPRSVLRKSNTIKGNKHLHFDRSLSPAKSDISLDQKDKPEVCKTQLSPTTPHLYCDIKKESQDITGIDENPFSPDIPDLSKTSPSVPYMPGLNASIETLTISSSPINYPPTEWWIPELDLRIEDLKILKSSTAWLNDGHMNAALTILKGQFPKINGFHDTKSVPFKIKDKWIYNKKLPITRSPAVQIHYNGVDHWVTSVKIDDNIYYLNSLSQSINTYLDIQLAAMYGQPGKELEIKVPNIQQQDDVVQCGVFAIANAVQFCVTNFCFWSKAINFEIKIMRDHLINCFQARKFTKFSSIKTYRRQYEKIHKISISCPCRLPDTTDKLVNCRNCGCAWHESCIGSKENKIQDICTKCR